MEKSILLSKTFWVGVVAAIAPLFPAVQAIMASSPEMVGMVVGAVFAVLRLISKDKVVLGV